MGTPRRIVVMTTNHLELLDQALICPGRFDKKLLMGYMQGEDVIMMIQHNFGTNLDDDQKQKHCVKEAIGGGEDQRSRVKLTPAQVEKYCCEYNSVDDMIVCLESVKGKGEMLRHPKYATTSEITIGS